MINRAYLARAAGATFSVGLAAEVPEVARVLEAERDRLDGVAPMAEVLAGLGERAAEVLRGVGALSAEPVEALRELAVEPVGCNTECAVACAVECTVLVLNAGVS